MKLWIWAVLILLVALHTSGRRGGGGRGSSGRGRSGSRSRTSSGGYNRGGGSRTNTGSRTSGGGGWNTGGGGGGYRTNTGGGYSGGGYTGGGYKPKSKSKTSIFGKGGSLFGGKGRKTSIVGNALRSNKVKAGLAGLAAGYVGYKAGKGLLKAGKYMMFGGHRYYYGNYYTGMGSGYRRCDVPLDASNQGLGNMWYDDHNRVSRLSFTCRAHESCCGYDCCDGRYVVNYDRRHRGGGGAWVIALIVALLVIGCIVFVVFKLCRKGLDSLFPSQRRGNPGSATYKYDDVQVQPPPPQPMGNPYYPPAQPQGAYGYGQPAPQYPYQPAPAYPPGPPSYPQQPPGNYNY